MPPWARPKCIVFDTIRRYLQYRGFEVNYVRNFTDVDDKIIARANQEAREWIEVADKYIGAFSRDMERLSVTMPDHEPRATEHMPGIIRMVSSWLTKESHTSWRAMCIIVWKASQITDVFHTEHLAICLRARESMSTA